MGNIAFDWDVRKARSNVAKHGVSFEEASTVFGDLLALTIYDPLHSEEEDRFVTLGESEKRRLIVVSFTDRDDAIARNRDLMGATDPKNAAAGTIRADFAQSIDANAVHGSDGPETAETEIEFFFPLQEIHSR